MAKHKKKSANPEQMALTGHLRELRNRAVICVLCLVVAFLVCLAYAPDIVEFLTDIGKEYGYNYIYVSPQELLMQQFSISTVAAVCVTFPVLIYQIWGFVRPGLKKKENILFVLAVVFGLLCFLAGVYFCYKIMLPFMLEFLIGISTGTDIHASITVENYISFLLTLFVIFGVIFEMPVAAVLLNQFGIIKVEWMKKARKVLIVVIFFIAAVVTPPDIVSQTMVAIPMLLLYEFSIMLCTVLSKFKRKKKDEDDEDETDGDEDEDTDEDDEEKVEAKAGKEA